MSFEQVEAQLTGADLACPKCHLFGCDCQPTMEALCGVCRRRFVNGKCCCASHVAHTSPLVDNDGHLVLRQSTPTEKIDAAEVEAMHYYYDTRDAKALAALVRELATKAYRV